MSNSTYYLIVLFMAGVLALQLFSGTAMGAWWSRNPTRQDNPGAYWFVVAVQGAVLIAFLVTGRTWHVR